MFVMPGLFQGVPDLAISRLQMVLIVVSSPFSCFPQPVCRPEMRAGR